MHFLYMVDTDSMWIGQNPKIILIIQMVNNDRQVNSVCKFCNTNTLVSAISDLTLSHLSAHVVKRLLQTNKNKNKKKKKKKKNGSTSKKILMVKKNQKSNPPDFKVSLLG